MTESLLKEKEQHDVPASESALLPTGIGPTLRSMREARRISLSEASQRLKFSVRQIEALEAEDWGRLPAGVALRGFVRNYARYMEADVESVLILLDNQVGSTAPRSVMSAPGAPLSVSADAELPNAAEASHRPWGWFLIILALLVIAAFYAIDRGWVSESWLVFDWLRNIANNE
jgi:cytoskeleton protein RodZ